MPLGASKAIISALPGSTCIYSETFRICVKIGPSRYNVNVRNRPVFRAFPTVPKCAFEYLCPKGREPDSAPKVRDRSSTR